jgi:thioredoxin 1
MKSFNVLLISVLISIASLNGFCQNFDFLMKDEPVKNELIIFSATWCGPCKVMKRDMFERPTKKMVELLDNYEITLYDLDMSRELARQYRVSSVPTLIVKEGNVEINRTVGYSSNRIYSFLNSNK